MSSLTLINSNKMIYPLSQCSDLLTRQIKWISHNDNINKGSFPSAYLHWGLPASCIAAQFAEVYHDEIVGCPISGWI